MAQTLFIKSTCTHTHTHTHFLISQMFLNVEFKRRSNRIIVFTAAIYVGIRRYQIVNLNTNFTINKVCNCVLVLIPQFHGNYNCWHLKLLVHILNTKVIVLGIAYNVLFGV